MFANSYKQCNYSLTNVENSSNAYGVAIQISGKIVVSGYSSDGANTGISHVRYNTNGTLDTTFGTGGIVITKFSQSPDVEAWAMELDGNDKIVTTGMIFDVDLNDNKIVVVRFNANGNLDTTFGTDGIVKTSVGNNDDFGNAVAIQPDNKIVVAGTSNLNAIVARYDINGLLDSTFGTGGILITDFGTNQNEAYGITIQNDEKILVVGVSGPNAQNTNGNFGIVRYNPDGIIDNTFGINGKVITDVSNGHNDVAFSVKEQSDGKIVVSGVSYNGSFYNISMARYNGLIATITEYISDNKITIYPNPANDEINIEIHSYKEKTIQNADIEIFNIHGQLLKTFKWNGPKTTIDLSILSNGIYTMKIKTDNGIMVKKIIKKTT